MSDAVDHVFVYGTLRPGDVRWHFLAPFVIGDALADSISGSLYDTGNDYPAAVFGGVRIDDHIHGATFRIEADRLHECLVVLDEEEDVAGGRYRRVVVRTARGIDAWAYEYCDGYDLVPIASGDWFEHRPPPAAH
jgi:gamma-glutamylcyclotransferase (GGCT)/AIG2-like uncharacterized protein YtfP